MNICRFEAFTLLIKSHFSYSIDHMNELTEFASSFYYLLELILITTSQFLDWFLSQETQTQFFILVPIVITIIIIWPARGAKHRHHKKNIKKARKIHHKIVKLSKKDNHDAIFKILHSKISPYVFEELVLTAFIQYGGKITRSASYSGDGGIDGKVKIKGKHYLIQSKKYFGYIKAADIKGHIALCRDKRALGFFIHSGLSGKMSKQATIDSPVTIIGREDLVSFLSGTLRI